MARDAQDSMAGMRTSDVLVFEYFLTRCQKQLCMHVLGTGPNLELAACELGCDFVLIRTRFRGTAGSQRWIHWLNVVELTNRNLLQSSCMPRISSGGAPGLIYTHLRAFLHALSARYRYTGFAGNFTVADGVGGDCQFYIRMRSTFSAGASRGPGVSGRLPIGVFRRQ